MDDVISRQAAIDALNDDFTIIGKVVVQDYIRRVNIRLHNLPSAHPEIIRCKDCKWRDITSPASTMTQTFYKCRCFEKLYTQEDDFCSRAERRE